MRAYMTVLLRARRCLAGCSLAILVATASGSSATAAAYRLEPGDVVEFSVASAPELRQRAPVSLDGEVSLPLIGQVRAAGRPVADLRRTIEELLPTKVHRKRAEDGREYPVIISPDAFTLTIVEYRPVYLNGDVAKPGEQAFRPGMTVRQAVALAGGYDLMRFRMGNPFLDQADLRSEYDVLWTQFAKEDALIARLQAELANKGDIDRKKLAKTPVSPSVALQIEALEIEQLKLRNADFQKERVYLQEAMKKEDGRIGLLSDQQKKEREGTENDASDLARVQDLFQKGAVPITRVIEARRSILLSSTRVLQTIAQLSQVERERDDVGRKLQRVDDQRRLSLLKDLQDAGVRLDTLRTRLEAVSEKLMYTGVIRSQLTRGKGAKPELTIVRKGENGRQQLPGDEDFELAPGDVVEVSLKESLLSAVPGQ